MDFNEIVAAATGGFVTCIAGYVGHRVTKWIDEREEQATKREQKLEKLAEDIAAMHSEIAELQTKMTRAEDKLGVMQNGVLALSRDRLVQSELHFIKQGEVPMQVKENLNQMEIAYTTMGGNGVVPNIHSEFMELPTTLG